MVAKLGQGATYISGEDADASFLPSLLPTHAVASHLAPGLPFSRCRHAVLPFPSISYLKSRHFKVREFFEL